MIYTVYFNNEKYEAAGHDFEHAAECFAETFDMDNEHFIVNNEENVIVEVEDDDGLKKKFAISAWYEPTYLAQEIK